MTTDTAGLPEAQWRCFHCDEVFTDRADAADHFGTSELQRPACQIDIRHVRWLEDEHRKSCDEDTAALRTIAGIVSEHETMRRRAEEIGYARGLADAKKHPGELGLMPQLPQQAPPGLIMSMALRFDHGRLSRLL